MNTIVDTMIYVTDSAAKQRLQSGVEAMPGVVGARLHTEKPHFMFVSYDSEKFDIRAVPRFAHEMGTEARIVDI